MPPNDSRIHTIMPTYQRNIGVWDDLGMIPKMDTIGSATYTSANRAHFQWFRVPEICVVKQLWVANGATASGNIDVGIYTPDGTRLVSSGSTAQSGTSTLQVFDVTDTTLAPGYYYIAVAMDNTTGTIRRNNLSTQASKFAGSAVMASAFPLPATATLATALGSAWVIGLTTETVV